MKYFEGKKTYLAAAALVVIAALSFWLELASDVQCMTILAIAFGMFGLGSKSERYGRMMIDAIEELKRQQAAGATAKDQAKAVGKVLAPEIATAVVQEMTARQRDRE